MENEDVKEVEDVDIELEDDEDDDKTDWKAEAEKAKAEADKYKAMAKRYKNKSTKAEPEETKKSNKVDYGQKAFLIANGIKGKDEMDLVQAWADNTGKDLDEILENKHFLNELKDLRDDKTAKEAMPSDSKRSGNQGRDSVEYWLAKGELPPADQFELRKQYVNAKMKRQSGAENPFYNAKR